MEILHENILKLIREQCPAHWELEVFRDHIIVNLPDTLQDHHAVYRQAKKEITQCVNRHFPERAMELLFEVRNGSWNGGFKLPKTTVLF
jgi:hypothetical protein